ncbi:protein rep [Chamaesiphon sp.]|uniref:protein rep n=1 Tax=Chamaesiphon sp. TaxID=2814140 RepID=UPI003593CBE5
MFTRLMMVKPGYFSNGYLSKEKWVELWKSFLKVDYAPSIHVKAVSKGQDLLKCLSEMVK